jgi:hypothetical protein
MHSILEACYLEFEDFRQCAGGGSYAARNKLLIDGGVNNGEGANNEVFFDDVTKDTIRVNMYAGGRKRLLSVTFDHTTEPISYTLSCSGDGNCPPGWPSP